MPKILPEDVSMRTVVREPQLVEQVVEVPTLVSPFLAGRREGGRKTRSWRWPAMPLAARGSKILDRAVVAGGGCRVRATPSGTTWRGHTARPGRKARDDVDVPSIMQLVFQQSKSYVFFAAFQFPTPLAPRFLGL